MINTNDEILDSLLMMSYAKTLYKTDAKALRNRADFREN
jgi:hypothetical protein